MDTAVSLDSFQLIVGLYLLYVAIRGSGTLYNFFDLSDEDRCRVNRPLRCVYAVCGVLALAEAGVCMWLGTAGGYGELLNAVSLAVTAVIVIILIVTFLWLRRLANKNGE